MTSGRKAVHAAQAAAEAADRIGEAFALRLQRVLRRTERAMPDLLDSLRIANPQAAQALVGASRQQIREALRRAGFDELVDTAYGDALSPVLQRMLALRRAGGFEVAQLTPAQALRLEAFGALYRLDLLGEGDAASRALWRAAVRGIFGSADQRAILRELSQVLERAEPQIQTLYDTSVSVVSRQVEALQANDDPRTLFAYVGPVDEVIRPWCIAHVGRVYSRDEIDAMDNGQIGPVFLTGGGYRCRHVWMELSTASELRELHGTTKRIPEVQADIDRLKDAA